VIDKLKARIWPTVALTRGKQFERLAGQHLKQRGLSLLATNYHTRFGEIDIIARDGDCLVFVEVRFRADVSHGSPVATVTPAKQEKIRRTALNFLQKHGLTNKMPSRFDVVGITGSLKVPSFRWIKNAF